MLPGRQITFNQGGRTPYNGMRIIGPLGAGGPKDPEIGNIMNHNVILNVGNGVNSWFNGTQTYYDIVFENIAFQEGNPNAQFWNQPNTTGAGLYGANFHSLTFYGFQSVFGSPSVPCAMTQVTFSGHWEVLAFHNTAMTIVGSDNDFWSAGYLNISTAGATPASGTPLLSFPILERTKIGYTYITVFPGWSGASFGGGGHGVSWYGPTFEGMWNQPATHELLKMAGGYLTIYAGRFHYIDPAAGVNGAIVQSGGHLSLDHATWDDSSHPGTVFLYQTAGHSSLFDPVGVAGNTVPFRRSDGTTEAAPWGAITSD
jgi:hypothetical protein